MPDDRRVFRALADFVHTLSGEYAIADVLNGLTDTVVPVVDLEGAGVSVGDDERRLRFVTASGEALVEIESLQENLQQGPCVDAFRDATVVTATDLATEVRWPDYTPAAVNLGFAAVAAVPLMASDLRIGSLNLYSTSRRDWRDDDLAVASLFAEMAANYLVNASNLARSERIREQQQRALESRIVIEQAKGIIAEQHNVTVDDAYRRLRDYTRAHNAHLHDVAGAVVHLDLHIP